MLNFVNKTARKQFDKAEFFETGIAADEISQIIRRAKSFYNQGKIAEEDGVITQKARTFYRQALELLRPDDPKNIFYTVEKEANR